MTWNPHSTSPCNVGCVPPDRHVSLAYGPKGATAERVVREGVEMARRERLGWEPIAAEAATEAPPESVVMQNEGLRQFTNVGRPLPPYRDGDDSRWLVTWQRVQP